MADYQSFDGHGVDVAVNRADVLDKKALDYVTEHPGCAVLDLGSGAGGQSVRMAAAGALVTAVDQFDLAEQLATLRTEHDMTAEQLQFVRGDITQLATLLLDQQYHLALMQRTLHYLTYVQAQELLTYLHSVVTDALFVSVTGLGSLIGDSYPCGQQAVEERFCTLTDLGQELFSISESMCLYTEAELQTLLTDTDWHIDSCRVTAFGNIQAICNRTT